MIEGLRAPDSAKSPSWGSTPSASEKACSSGSACNSVTGALARLTVEETLKVFQSLFKKRTPLSIC
jgi:hypothetical protein